MNRANVIQKVRRRITEQERRIDTLSRALDLRDRQVNLMSSAIKTFAVRNFGGNTIRLCVEIDASMVQSVPQTVDAAMRSLSNELRKELEKR